MCRPAEMIQKFVTTAFGVPESEVNEVPLIKQLNNYSDIEKVNLLQLRILCYARNTWNSMLNGIKRYISFCMKSNKAPFPVDLNSLQLCLVDLVKEGKSVHVIGNNIDSVLFRSNFLGWPHTSKDFTFKNISNAFQI